MQRVKAKFPGMIPSSEYARKYLVGKATVLDMVKRGDLTGMRDGIYWHVEDKAPQKKTEAAIHRNGKKLCSVCQRWLVLERYSPSRRQKSAPCKDCTAHSERVRNGRGSSAESLSYKREVVAELEIKKMRELGMMKERNARIRAHAARIAAAGYAGDGEVFPDGE